ncbi:MAG: Ppx/GppA phosphatase family protein [Gemmatimonadaceae bacterium]|nr:Ppx/GppA phosphatase family protein [Gemmatimonadaceae bacterium]
MSAPAGRELRLTRDEPAQRIAAIDIGSNSIRLMIADVSPNGAIRVMDELKAHPRLATGLLQTGRLDESSMTQAIDAMTRMAALARQQGCRRIEAVATSAVRDAANGREFLERVRRQTGLRPRVLSGSEEARLAFLSALAHFDLGTGRAVVMDIGGGSLELALAADGVVERLVSLPYGAIRLTEEHMAKGITPKRLRKMRKAIRDEIRAVLPVRDWRGAQVIGSGGTFTNLAGMLLHRQGVTTFRGVHGTTVPREDLEHILELLSGMPSHERVAMPGLNAGRADIIVAGLAVAAEVLARVEPRALTVSAYGIREGLLLDVAKVRPIVQDPGEARFRSVSELAVKCRYEAPHAHQVQRLALQLYDALGARLGCEPGDRAILADAALLHDIGYHINYSRHHKHSYHLILHAELLGMTPADQVAVAHVARYHRGALPKRTHPEFALLPPAQRKRVRRLAALLRVADGLDRGHVQSVQQVKVRVLDRAIRLTPVPMPGASPRLDLWGAARKSDLLALLFDRPVEIVGPDGKVVSHDETVTDAD